MNYKISRTLLYIPHKNKNDIVRTAWINNKVYYSVTDIIPDVFIPGSVSIWNYEKGMYDQYNKSLNNIYQNHKKILPNRVYYYNNLINKITKLI